MEGIPFKIKMFTLSFSRRIKFQNFLTDGAVSYYTFAVVGPFILAINHINLGRLVNKNLYPKITSINIMYIIF